jgi:hypothetical protein
MSNTDGVDKLNNQDDTVRYRNWTDGAGMASWNGAGMSGGEGWRRRMGGGEQNAGEEWARRMAVKMVVVETSGRDGGNDGGQVRRYDQDKHVRRLV